MQLSSARSLPVLRLHCCQSAMRLMKLLHATAFIYKSAPTHLPFVCCMLGIPASYTTCAGVVAAHAASWQLVPGRQPVDPADWHWGSWWQPQVEASACSAACCTAVACHQQSYFWLSAGQLLPGCLLAQPASEWLHPAAARLQLKAINFLFVLPAAPFVLAMLVCMGPSLLITLLSKAVALAIL